MEHTSIQVPYGVFRRSFFDERHHLKQATKADFRRIIFWKPQRERVSEALTSETLVFGGDEKIRTSDTLLGYAPLAGECLRPLGHVKESINQLVTNTAGFSC